MTSLRQRTLLLWWTATAVATACTATNQPPGGLSGGADGGDATASVAADVDRSEATRAADAQQDVAGEDAVEETAVPLPTKGNAVAPGQGLPEMTQVVDSEGQSVGHDNLLGQWTVMWFYPAAQTAG